MPRGKKHPAAATAAPADAQKGNGAPSKAEAFRQVYARLGKDASNADIADAVKREFNLEIDPKTVSVYKSNLKKKSGGKGDGRRRRGGGRKGRRMAMAAPALDVGTLTSLAAVAKEAGGIQALRRQLDVLERLQLGGGVQGGNG